MQNWLIGEGKFVPNPIGKVYAMKAAAPLVCGSQEAVPIIIMSGNHKNICQIPQMR